MYARENGRCDVLLETPMHPSSWHRTIGLKGTGMLRVPALITCQDLFSASFHTQPGSTILHCPWRFVLYDTIPLRKIRCIKVPFPPPKVKPLISAPIHSSFQLQQVPSLDVNRRCFTVLQHRGPGLLQPGTGRTSQHTF